IDVAVHARTEAETNRQDEPGDRTGSHARPLTPLDRERKPDRRQHGHDDAVRHARRAEHLALQDRHAGHFLKLVRRDDHAIEQELEPVDHERGEHDRQYVVALKTHGRPPLWEEVSASPSPRLLLSPCRRRAYTSRTFFINPAFARLSNTSQPTCRML